MELVCELTSSKIGVPNFVPTGLAANEERNECYIRIIGLDKDEICVFDMTNWALRKIWTVTKRQGELVTSLECFSGIAFNKINGLLYLPTHTSNGFYVLNPITGMLVKQFQVVVDSVLSEAALRSTASYPSALTLWTGNLAHLGNCLVVCFTSMSVVHVYNCDTLKLSMSFHIHQEARAYSIQCHRDEFYVGEFGMGRISVYSLSGIYQREISRVFDPATRMRSSPCISIHPPSQTMAILDYHNKGLLLIE